MANNNFATAFIVGNATVQDIDFGDMIIDKIYVSCPVANTTQVLLGTTADLGGSTGLSLGPGALLEIDVSTVNLLKALVGTGDYATFMAVGA